MVSINKVIDTDGITVYVKVIVKNRRIDIVWDKSLPLSTVRRLLLLLMLHVIGLLKEGDSSTKHGRDVSVRLHVFKYHDDYDINIANRECVEKLRA